MPEGGSFTVDLWMAFESEPGASETQVARLNFSLILLVQMFNVSTPVASE